MGSPIFYGATPVRCLGSEADADAAGGGCYVVAHLLCPRETIMGVARKSPGHLFSASREKTATSCGRARSESACQINTLPLLETNDRIRYQCRRGRGRSTSQAGVRSVIRLHTVRCGGRLLRGERVAQLSRSSRRPLARSHARPLLLGGAGGKPPTAPIRPSLLSRRCRHCRQRRWSIGQNG